MQKTILNILLLFCCAQVAQAALVQGLVKGASPGTKLEIEVPHYYLDGRSSHFKGSLDAQSRFSIEVPVSEPGIAFFVFNDDRLPIFLADSDTLSVKTDAFQFPVSVSFDGKSAADNRLFQEYLKQNALDFNEFNNIRFKIGLSWIPVEDPMNGLMENLAPELFKGAMDAQKITAINLVEAFSSENPDALSPVFLDWINTEITYRWAFHLLIYGQVYAARYGIQPDFFDFLYDAPIVRDQIGSDWYRQFLLAFMARQQAKISPVENYWSGQYALAGKLLDGKSLAFLRSELIATAFSSSYLTEILPLYTDFLQHNPFTIFDDKVEGLYQKYARVSPGANAPDFDAIDHKGQPISLTQFHGKIIYLNFWASWCGACLRKMEFFDEFDAELAANGIVVLNVSIDEVAAKWEAALSAHPFKGHHLLASSDQGQNIARSYGVEAVPQYFIIGRTGLFEVKALSSQPNDIRQQLLDISARRR